MRLKININPRWQCRKFSAIRGNTLMATQWRFWKIGSIFMVCIPALMNRVNSARRISCTFWNKLVTSFWVHEITLLALRKKMFEIEEYFSTLGCLWLLLSSFTFLTWTILNFSQKKIRVLFFIFEFRKTKKILNRKLQGRLFVYLFSIKTKLSFYKNP